jgi:hypothetical protein
MAAKAKPSEPGVDPVPAIRALLKAALRSYGFRCVSLRTTGGDASATLPREGAVMADVVIARESLSDSADTRTRAPSDRQGDWLTALHERACRHF